MFATCRVRGNDYFRSFDGGSVRIKSVKTLYFSGAGTFPQFSAGHRNLSYPCPKSLHAASEAIHVSTGSHVTSNQSTLGVSTVEALMRIPINGVISPEHYHRMKRKELSSWAHKSERIFIHFTVTHVYVWLVKNLFWLVDQTCH